MTDKINISDISVRKNTEQDSRVKAYVSIVINDAIKIHRIRIIQGDEKLFIAMPSVKKDDMFIDIVHPINKETREKLETAIVNEYLKQ